MVNTIAPGSSEIKLWPNPVHDQITVQGESQIESVAVIDALGRPCSNLQVLEKGGKTAIDVQHLPVGVYFILVKFPGYLWAGKFLKVE